MSEPCLARRLEGELAAEYAEMHVIRGCLESATNSLALFFNMALEGPPSSLENQTIRSALFNYGIVEFTACFTTNAAKRSHLLIVDEALGNINGGVEAYHVLYNHRNSFAAHNHGTQREAIPIVLIENDELVSEVGILSFKLQEFTADNSRAFYVILDAAKNHVQSRIEELQISLNKFANELSPEELKALPIAEKTVSDAKAANRGRPTLSTLKKGSLKTP